MSVSKVSYMDMPVLIPVAPNHFALVDARMVSKVKKYKWKLTARSYAACLIGGSCLLMHRLVADAPDDKDVDHRNHNGLDNRLSNLRLCTPRQNSGNARKQHWVNPDRMTSSRFKGVSFRSDRKRWTAYVGTGKNRWHLGCFESEEEAARAYNKAAVEYFGEFAKLNKFDEDN